MYTPPHFVVEDPDNIRAMMRACRLATFVTATQEGPMATPLPMFLDESEGEHGVLYGHLARPNRQWQEPAIGPGLAIFMGRDAYVTPSWYASKAEHGKVVPTWNYEAVHASGPVEFFVNAERLLDVVTKLTRLHEGAGDTAWAVSDAPANFIAGQLRGIIGLRMPIVRLEGKRKMSQNRNDADRQGVREGLLASTEPGDRLVGVMIK